MLIALIIWLSVIVAVAITLWHTPCRTIQDDTKAPPKPAPKKSFEELIDVDELIRQRPARK